MSDEAIRVPTDIRWWSVFDSLVDVWLDDCSVADSANIGGRVLALDDPLEQPDARQPGRLRRHRCSFAGASKRVGV